MVARLAAAARARVWPSVESKLETLSIPEPNSGCVLWIGAINEFGYGSARHKGKSWPAHRLSWTVTHGPIPNGLHVLHRCDNPPCINPAHLFLGTHLDNMRDMKAKGRFIPAPKRTGESHYTKLKPHLIRRGEQAPSARLSEAQALDILRLCAEGVPQSRIAQQFGLIQQTVSDIRRGKRWSHLPREALCAVGLKREGT